MLACQSVYVKPRGIQVSTYHAHSRQSERQNIIDKTQTAMFGHYIGGHSNN